jgi:hypothetical protein
MSAKVVASGFVSLMGECIGENFMALSGCCIGS